MGVSTLDSFADLLDQLGGISPKRVRLNPPPGRATEKDVVRIQQNEGRLYELVDSTLVEKVGGYPEGYVAGNILVLLRLFVVPRDLGLVNGTDGMLRLMRRLIRIPDVSFVSWRQLPSHEIPDEPVPNLYPELAVEVISTANTKAEMRRKLREYFRAGARLVWMVYPKTRTVVVCAAPNQFAEFTEADTLDGGDVLPGLAIPVSRIFEMMPRPAKVKPSPNGGPKKPRPRKK
ncbi:MAG: Uma2 family endonuclease [Gemmataceae bacterium]